MTTSDARKRLDESIDRLERTRTHSINPQTGQFTRLDQESDTMTDHQLSADNLINEVWMDTGDLAQVHALLAIHATLTEIRDRLPERESRITCMDCGTDLNPGDPLDCAKHAPADLEWLAESVPVPHPDEALAKVLHDADSNGHFSWEGTGLEARADYLRMARVAREHIEDENHAAYCEEIAKMLSRADKAEADLARVTARYDALRADVETKWSVPGNPHLRWRREDILARDDARAEGQS